ncbi:MAG: Gfo/Idh/MocA family oxidoreductase [Chloroflexi bacterium]|nr:Gfo/Idh/MocA family oxidoreductase [Chloroflexota bacterium]
MEPVQVGVIGTGWGELQIAAWQRVKNARVVAVCDLDAARAADLAKRMKIERSFTDYRQLLAIKELQLVSIAAPTDTHRSIADAALIAGKHVVCEKPLALDAREAQSLLARAEEHRAVHAVNFEMRYLPGFQYAKELIDEDYLGQLLRVDVTMAMENPWGEHGKWAADDARGGGVLMELGSHFIDALHWWFDDARAVLAGRRTLFPKVKSQMALAGGNGKSVDPIVTADDAFWCVMQFARGGEALLNFVTGARHDPGWTINAHGSLGTLVIKNGELWGRRDGDRELAPLGIPKRLEVTEKPNDPLLWGMVKLFERVVARIQGDNAQIFPDFRDGVALARTIDAIKCASDEQEWVEVD